MAARQCEALTAAGQPCRRAPSRDSRYCLAHDPERRAEHLSASSKGGIVATHAELREIRDEIAQVIVDMRNGTLNAGVGAVILQALRLLRDVEAEDARAPDAHDFILSIQRLRDNPDVPDLSEPAPASSNGGGGYNALTGNREPDELDAEIEASAERRRQYDELDVKPWSELTADERQWLKGERVRRRMRRGALR
jgi:hypothetical protein